MNQVGDASGSFPSKSNSPSMSASKRKRTRRELGSTNRKQLQNSTEDVQQNATNTTPTTHAPQSPSNNKTQNNNNNNSKSPTKPKNRSSPPPHNVKSKLFQSTTASTMKLQGTDDDTIRRQQDNLDMMKCKFTATFEEGSNNHLKTGATYKLDPSSTKTPPAPTRFSPKPPPGNTHELTIGEPGTTFHATDSTRFTTSQQDPVVAERENKILRDEHEKGRLERIRTNNARVESVTDEVNNAHVHNQVRRVNTVQKQQKAYQKAIEDRIAKGLD